MSWRLGTWGIMREDVGGRLTHAKIGCDDGAKTISDKIVNKIKLVRA